MNKERKGFKDGSPYYFLIFIVTSIVNPLEPGAPCTHGSF